MLVHGHLKVNFKHETTKVDVVNNEIDTGVGRKTRKTTCTISTVDDGKILSTGKAIVGKKDKFCRNKGRKVSMQRALNEADLPKEIRKEIWGLYENKVSGW